MLIEALTLLCALGTLLVNASVHEYQDVSFVPQGNAFVYFGGSEGLYESTWGSGKSGVANGRSYIRFDQSLALHSKGRHNTSFVNAVVFDVADRDKLGGSLYGGQVDLCCTADLAQELGCAEGDIIRRPSPENPEWPQLIKLRIQPDKVDTSFPTHELAISKTGMYVLFFVHCDDGLKGLTIRGNTVWKNPSGYLPGRMIPLLTFYGLMSVAYLALGLYWLFQYVRFWRDILQLQNYITLVIGLGMAEMAAWYFEYINFNMTGRRPVGITLWAVTLGAVKKTVSRLVILVVSMGYGVVQPTLGGLTSKVLCLGGAYLLASESLDVVEHVGRVDEISYRVKLLLVLPVAILDSFFILWTFTSLSRTLEKLQAKKQSVKLGLYRKFTNALAIAVLVAVGWVGYEVYFKATDAYGERWRSAWIISAFWNIAAFLVLCVICALWAPSQNARRYAYSDDVGGLEEEEEEEESIPLTSSKQLSPLDGDTIKPERKEKKIVSTDVFRLDVDDDEDEEQGKRE